MAVNIATLKLKKLTTMTTSQVSFIKEHDKCSGVDKY